MRRARWRLGGGRGNGAGGRLNGCRNSAAAAAARWHSGHRNGVQDVVLLANQRGTVDAGVQRLESSHCVTPGTGESVMCVAIAGRHGIGAGAESHGIVSQLRVSCIAPDIRSKGAFNPVCLMCANIGD